MAISASSTPAAPARVPDWLTGLVGVIAIFLILVMMVGGVLPFLAQVMPIARWAIVIGLMVVLLLVIGYRTTNGIPLGVLIDTTNHMSLSRLQIILWTVLTLSAYLMIVSPRIFGGMPGLDEFIKKFPNDERVAKCREALKDQNLPLTIANCGGGALQITFPQELILAMGISAASFAGSSLVQSSKRKKRADPQAQADAVASAQAALKTANASLVQAKNESTAAATALIDKFRAQAATIANPAATADEKRKDAEAVAKAEADVQRTADQVKNVQAEIEKSQAALADAQQAQEAARVEAEGLLHRNENPSQAAWVDLFRGNEIGNYQLVDMGKVQMFFFTIVIIFAYGAAVLALLNDPVALSHPLGVDFPPFSQSLNALLFISHAAYLSNNTIDHTPTQS